MNDDKMREAWADVEKTLVGSGAWPFGVPQRAFEMGYAAGAASERERAEKTEAELKAERRECLQLAADLNNERISALYVRTALEALRERVRAHNAGIPEQPIEYPTGFGGGGCGGTEP